MQIMVMSLLLTFATLQNARTKFHEIWYWTDLHMFVNMSDFC